MSLENVQRLSSVMNFDELLTRCLNNIEFAERMLTLFHGRCADDVAELEEAFNRSDIDSVRRIAHRLAGASANAAATGLQSRAAELRRAVDRNATHEIQPRLLELREEWRRFADALSESRQLQSIS